MSRRSRVPTPYAFVQHFFGAEIRLPRQRARMSTLVLGPRVLVSPDLLSKVEKGERYPTLDLAGRLDKEVEAAGALVRLHGLVAAERAVQEHLRRRVGRRALPKDLR